MKNDVKKLLTQISKSNSEFWRPAAQLLADAPSTEFQECDTCFQKGGVLCKGCTHNRGVIARLTR